LNTIRQLWLGLVLIVAASMVLLVSDWGRREKNARTAATTVGVEKAVPERLVVTGDVSALDFAEAKRAGMEYPLATLLQADRYLNVRELRGRLARVALVNLIYARSLELGEAGVRRGLLEAGLVEGEDFTLRKFNAQGDIAQLPALLDAAANWHPDVLVTVTTPAMIAAVNRIKDIPVVFTIASSPIALGIFTKETVPANLTGVHDEPALGDLLDMARRHVPGLKSVGIAYDASQANSVLTVTQLRAECAKRNLVLHEVTVSSMTDLGPAVQSLVQRGMGALIVSTDNLINSGFAVVAKTAAQAGVPIFTTDADFIEEGATGAIGDNYELWGVQSGELVAKVLAGVPVSALPLGPTRTHRVIPPKGAEGGPPLVPPTVSRPYEIRVIRYNDAAFAEETSRGVEQGFIAADWQPGRHFRLKTYNAQGDMTTLNSIMASCRADAPDVVIPISTPALQGALRQAGELPIVYGCVASGVQAGAGQSAVEHLPNVTGVDTLAPYDAMARLIRQMLPGARAVGTLYSPGEVNAEYNREVFMAALKQEGLRLVSVPIQGTAATAESVNTLLHADIQVICQIVDNAARPGFAHIAKRATQAGLPFFCFDPSALPEGVALAMGRNYYDSGRETAELAMRVLRGESPGGIPFVRTDSRELVVNEAALNQFGLALPAEWREGAKVWTGEPHAN
jgi:ABC-type uncharacterized transport system substrate-binding protein